MAIYYGNAGRSGNRYGERFTQLRVRQRLAHTLRTIVKRQGGWVNLPRGPQDIRLLQSTRAQDDEEREEQPDGCGAEA